MEIILIALLLIGILAFVAYPLFNPSRGKIAGETDALETLIAQRDSTYDAIRDLDFDFQLGKLSQDDYTTLRDKYKARAAQVLQQLDALGNGNGKDADADIEVQVAKLRRANTEADVEAQVARLRRAKTDSVEDEIARVRAARKSGGGFCSKCGTPHQAGDKFCAKCGNKL